MRLTLVFLSLWLITSTLFFHCNQPFADTGDVEVDRILDHITASTMAILPIIVGLVVLLFVRKTRAPGGFRESKMIPHLAEL